jgi:O-antigen biosynthesis protein
MISAIREARRHMGRSAQSAQSAQSSAPSFGEKAALARAHREEVRVAAHGKSFLLDGSPFRFRGLRYRRSPELADPPDRDADQLRLDLAAIAAAGYTVVSTPALPPPAIEQATASGLRFMLELDDPNLNRLATASRRQRSRLIGEASTRLRRAVQAWGGSETLVGVALGGSPQVGRSRAEFDIARRVANELAIALQDEDASLLTAWRSAWPVDSGCPPEFDFLIADFEVSRRDELVPALMACHCDVGDRPLVLGSVSVTNAGQGGERDIGWLIDTALRCGAGGTIAQVWSQPETAEPDSKTVRTNRLTVRDLDVDWPPISVVVCAYNAEATLEECLSHCDRLEYPKLELLVVDDGSTDATPAIARGHPRTQLITIPHAGLTVARNVGYQSARGDLIAYLDPDAYPSPEWPWYLALAALGERVGGSGGPNVPPPDEPASARAVALIPGGPVPQLLRPERAEHLPGCNMAFWRQLLEQLHGFDRVFLQAGDDVEFEWRVVESGHEMAYHPAALVWHHRRPGLVRFLRQQRNYGRSQAVLERRYPERFPTGHRLRNRARRLRSTRTDARGATPCRVRYLSLPKAEGMVLELAHQWGMPVAVALGLTAPAGLVRRKFAAPAAAAAAFVGALFATDVALAGQGRRRSEKSLMFSAQAAAFRVLRPLAFRSGHLRGWWELRRRTPDWPPAPGRGEHDTDA